MIRLAAGATERLDAGMQDAGPPPTPQIMEDGEHLKLLSIFHYVLAGLTALAGFFPLIYVLLGGLMVSGSMSSGSSSGPPPAIGWFMIAVGAGITLLVWACAVLLFLAGRWIAERRNRLFCFVMAAISCAGFPLGTALGVFTILVLLRPSVRVLFDQARPGGYLNR